MSDNPAISVIMPVYNAGEFVGEAIQSVLDQTFRDYEFIIINDGSTDYSLQIIESFKDSRIKVLRNPLNIGNYPSRNKGMNIAHGKYICVMDADDIAFPNRFERQYSYMEDNPETGLAGSGFRYFGNNSDILRENNFERIKVILLRNDCFIHPTLIMRNQFLKKYNLRYNEKYYYAADYDLIVRASRYFPVTNINEILLNYRIHKDQITTRYRQRQMEYADDIAIDQLKYIGLTPDEIEIRLHLDLLKGNYIELGRGKLLVKWIEKILQANQKNDYYYDINELESFFSSLFSRQPYLKETVESIPSVHYCKNNTKTDLKDVTFLINIKIDSGIQNENLISVTDFITRYFSTHILIIESDNEQHYFPEKDSKYIHYQYIKKGNDVHAYNKQINNVLLKTATPFIAIWDANAIVPPGQILEAVNKLRKNETILSYPYDGRFCCCDELTSTLFRKTCDVEVLSMSVSGMSLRFGYYSVSGAVILNKRSYMALGGEKVILSNSELEDKTRHKIIELSNLPVSFSEGCLFRLWYPAEKHGLLGNSAFKINDLRRYLRICSVAS